MITKAIIPVAGWGTRRLPITKAIEKCMLPVGNRPLVDYVVQDCIKAGIKDIYFVVAEDSVQLRAYYSTNPVLESYLKANNKDELIPIITLPSEVNFTYVTQPSESKYGTAVPVSLMADYIEPGESVVVLMGDDFIYTQDGSSEVARLVAAAPQNGCAMLGVTIPREQVSGYGVLEYTEDNKFVRIVEKPKIEEAPSNLINVSKYVLSYEALQEVFQYTEAAKQNGEYYITDPINTYVQKGGVIQIVPAKGMYLDGGTVEGWLKANQIVLGK